MKELLWMVYGWFKDGLSHEVENNNPNKTQYAHAGEDFILVTQKCETNRVCA